MRSKIILILSILVVVLIVIASVLGTSYVKQKEERKIAEQNLVAKTTELSTYITKHGDSVKVLQGMRLNINDVRKIEKELIKKVKDLEIKLKNATGIIQVVETIKYVNKDSIIYVPLTDTTRLFSIKDKWLNAEVTVTNFEYIAPGGFKILDIPNVNTLVPSIKYKGWWIFKKMVGVEVFINNTNPYIQTTSGTYIDLRKTK